MDGCSTKTSSSSSPPTSSRISRPAPGRTGWHPTLLADAKVLPRWLRADDPPDGSQKRLILLPKCCESWAPAGWAERVSGENCVVVRGFSERDEMLAAALAPWGESVAVDPD